MKPIIMLLAITVFAGCFDRTAESTGLEGNSLPSFNLLLPDSSTYFNTSSIQAGKPSVLICFGTRCPYSRAQMEEIINKIALLRDIRFFLFTPEPFREMKHFYEAFQLKNYPNIITGVDYNNFFSNYFGAEGVPYMAIYDKNKQLKESFIGKVECRQIKQVAFD